MSRNVDAWMSAHIFWHHVFGMLQVCLSDVDAPFIFAVRLVAVDV